MAEGSGCGENFMRNGVGAHHRSLQRLWGALPSREQLGSKVLTGGDVVAHALDQLVPQELLSAVVSRPELADYGPNLLWVKAQMEHARDATQAQQISTAASSTCDRHGDVHMSAVLWHLQGECPKLTAGGDWSRVGPMALATGKGKGKGTAQGDCERKGRIRRAPGKAETALTGTVTAVEPWSANGPVQALGRGNVSQGQGEPC